MQKYFSSYQLQRNERRVGTALGVLAALFALFLTGGILLFEHSFSELRQTQLPAGSQSAVVSQR